MDMITNTQKMLELNFKHLAIIFNYAYKYLTSRAKQLAETKSDFASLINNHW